MTPRLRAALLWGVVGGVTVLVAGQGLRLVGPPPVSYTAMLGVAVVVTAVTTAVAYAVGPPGATGRDEESGPPPG
ncbi:MAG: hypothetical protein ABEJ35_03505 [Halobacteriaceae archaeon]